VDIFLVRHAEAIDETLELRDPMRHLTAHGREQARALGDRMRWHDCTPVHIWTSPLVRAVQTAELIATGLETKVAIEVAPRLAPGEDARAIVNALKALTGDIVLVGHEPVMSALATLLVGKDVGTIAKAEAVRIADGQLRWRCAWNSEAPSR
jgi:phosphohistidine phosphatase